MPEKGGGFAEPTMVLLLDQQSSEQYLTDTKLGVVDWFINGKHYLRLDKREVKQTEKGPRSKSKGLSLKDLEIIGKNWAAVMRALGSKLPEHAAGAAMASGPTTPPAPAPRAASNTVESDF